MTLANGNAPTTTSWNFSVAEKPVLSAMTLASGTTTKTVNPLISLRGTDNSCVTTWTATVDGKPITAGYKAIDRVVLSTRMIKKILDGG